jgi:rRNA-processing protein EBP2
VQVFVTCPYILVSFLFKLQEEELRHEAKFTKIKGKGQKMQNVKTDDLALNDFQRETLFHRQAQAAVLIAIPKLKEQGVKTKRPDDYFAEMAKSDQHMQKVSILLFHSSVFYSSLSVVCERK